MYRCGLHCLLSSSAAAAYIGLYSVHFRAEYKLFVVEHLIANYGILGFKSDNNNIEIFVT